mmetsp:Transcript_4958/g.15671  ORF Transcript_4958/g.15671 Transcript_4958/m.15671 type:complete len:306 (-) Transcript_4958:529-1446(-)
MGTMRTLVNPARSYTSWPSSTASAPNHCPAVTRVISTRAAALVAPGSSTRSCLSPWDSAVVGDVRDVGDPGAVTVGSVSPSRGRRGSPVTESCPETTKTQASSRLWLIVSTSTPRRSSRGAKARARSVSARTFHEAKSGSRRRSSTTIGYDCARCAWRRTRAARRRSSSVDSGRDDRNVNMVCREKTNSSVSSLQRAESGRAPPQRHSRSPKMPCGPRVSTTTPFSIPLDLRFTAERVCRTASTTSPMCPLLAAVLRESRTAMSSTTPDATTYSSVVRSPAKYTYSPLRCATTEASSACIGRRCS